MAKVAPQYHKFIRINDLMSDEYRHRVVQCVLSKRGTLSKNANDRLKKSINERITLPGFRPGKAYQAKPEALLLPVIHEFQSANEITAAVLYAWLDHNQSLAQVVDAYLADRHELQQREINWNVGFRATWSADDMESHANEIIKMNSSLNCDDVKLMLCIRTGCLPVLVSEQLESLSKSISEEVGNQVNEPESLEAAPVVQFRPVWQSFVEELGKISADAPEWDQIDELIEDLRQLAAAKIDARGKNQARIRQLIQEIKDQAPEKVKYFVLNDLDIWDPQELPSANTLAVVELLEGLKNLLLAHQELSSRKASNYIEGGQIRQELAQIEDEVPTVYSKLQSYFGKRGEPITSEPQYSPEQPESRAENVSADPEVETSRASEVEASSSTVESVSEKESERAPTLEPSQQLPETTATGTSARAAISSLSEPESLAQAPADTSASTSVSETTFAPTSEVEEPVISTGDEPKHSIPDPDSQDNSIQSLAGRITGDDPTNAWRPLVWSLVRCGNIPFAYWAVKSQEELGNFHDIPSWLLEALHGSSYLENESQSLVTDLLDLSINDLPEAKENTPLAFLLIAAAIKPALIAPYSGLSAWLRELAVSDALDRVISAVMAFSEHGIPLHAEDVAAAAGLSQRGDAVQDVVQSANDWLVQASSRKFKFARATSVWRYLVKPGGDLHTLLIAVIENRQSELEDIQGQIKLWRKPDYRSNRIDAIDHSLVQIKPKPIMGVAREQLEKHIQEAIEIVSQWCSLVTHEKDVVTQGKRIFTQVTTLRSELSKFIDQAIADLDELCSPTQRLELDAAATYLKSALKQLAQIMKIEIRSGFEFVGGFNTFGRHSSSITDDLRQYLLLLPEIDLEDNLAPVTFENVITAIATYYLNKPSLTAVFEKHLQKQDYRFIQRFDGLIDTVLDTLIREHISSSQGHLRDQKTFVANEVEQAVVDGIITDAERSAFMDRIEQIDSENSLNFRRHYQILQKISEQVRLARSNRLSDLINIWHELRPKVIDASSISPENKPKIIDSIEGSIARADTRLLEEYIARTKAVLDEFRDWDASIESQNAENDSLKEFLQVASEINTLIGQHRLDEIARQIRADTFRDGRAVRKTPAAPRREEAENAIKAWRRLKSHKNDRNSDVLKSILYTLLSYLGFVFDNRQADAIQIEFAEDSLFAQVSMSDSEQAKPIHQFGSSAAGKYQLICLWERPGNETIASRLRQFRLKNDNVIVFFLGRLGTKQRENLIQMSFAEKLTMIVLDEILLVYLAQEHDSRLSAFLRCAVPFSALNPYTPFQAGDVPPEMFYGRRDMMATLQQQTGSCIVYGGRQLGKSALLKQVEREFNNPDRGQYAKVLDIKLVGDEETQTPTSILWTKLRQALNELGLFIQDIRSNRPDEIEKHIRKFLNEDPQRRILILFDEADNFLDADARQNFKITERLRTLMVETDRRFKVVFAGLHNVQRFQSNPNQPLAHFGTPLLIGPLDAKSAIDLIQEPLQFLGYHFTDISGPLRILTFTNYHPGLIQLFCQELLDRIRGNKPNRLPPYEITQNDIEAVYREVRDKIRERFEWTLALDPSYQAIALSMIYDQISVRDSYSHSYTPSEILDMVRVWLPKLFEDMTLDAFTGLLHEMKGLGVLARDNNGNYRLRSPNVVRLMGSEKEIEIKLEELIDSPALTRSSDNFHSAIEKGVYSPFNLRQERRMNSFESGVSLLFGDNSLFDQKHTDNSPVVRDLIKRMLNSNDSSKSNDRFIDVPLYVSSGSDLKQYIDNKITKDDERVFVYYSLEACSVEEMISLVQGALEYASEMQKRRGRKQILRIFFGFAPRAMRVWLTLESFLRKGLENRADIFYPLLWTEDGISHRLELEQMWHRKDICEKIIEVTGGSYRLINILFERLATRNGRVKDDPRDEIERLDQELSSKNPQLVDGILKDLSIDAYPLTHHILNFVMENSDDAIPTGLISPEYIPFNAETSAERYESALTYLERLNCISIRTTDGNSTVNLSPWIKKVL